MVSLVSQPVVRPLLPAVSPSQYKQTNLEALEAESIHILREVVAEFERPVMLYSIGKDSSVMVHLARKAFYPAPLPFPLLHVDTTYKFPEMIAFRDRFCREIGAKLIVHTNHEALARGINPWHDGTVACCGALKTRALLEALRSGRYDAAFGGARRAEEKSRAKERIFSFRDRHGQWDPRNQRPELWNLYNARVRPGESIRVFPLSNWTELDIWHYILLEDIPVVPMYFAAPREVISRDNLLIPVIDRARVAPGDHVETVECRFRTLGCWPCTGAIRSRARTVREIVAEMMTVRHSERITRIIDHDQDSSMEQKKREGYF